MKWIHMWQSLTCACYVIYLCDNGWCLSWSAERSRDSGLCQGWSAQRSRDSGWCHGWSAIDIGGVTVDLLGVIQ